jgi:hypothetical protein
MRHKRTLQCGRRTQWLTLRDDSSRKGVAARLVKACQYDALD